MSKINNFILCFLLCNSTLLSQNNFYDIDTIREIRDAGKEKPEIYELN